MKKIIYNIIGCFLLMPFVLNAQVSFSVSPENPKPGDEIHFQYRPAAKIFEGKEIKCVVTILGVYNEEYNFVAGNNPRQIEIMLKKNGNDYVGKLDIDQPARLLAFTFQALQPKGKTTNSAVASAVDSTDHNGNEGYCITVHDAAGKELPYSNYFHARYLYLENYNLVGIYNLEKAVTYLKRELELYPDSKYFAFFPLSATWKKTPDSLQFRPFAEKELEKLFDKGLTTKKDWILASTIAWALNLKNLGQHFYTQSEEKFKNTGGVSDYRLMYNAFSTESDFSKMETIYEQMAVAYPKLSYDEKVNVGRTKLVPFFLRFALMEKLAGSDRLDELKSYLQKFKISAADNPYSFWNIKVILDTLVQRGKYTTYAEQLALRNYSIYQERLKVINAGGNLAPTPYDAWYSAVDKKLIAVQAAAYYADLCANIYDHLGQYKKGVEYATQAQNYAKMDTLVQYYSGTDFNLRYSLLAEKAMPVKQYKPVVEKLVAAGQYKPEMVDVLKRAYVKQHGSEAGFEDYIQQVKQPTMDATRKSLVSQKVDIAAPQFTLKDIDGNLVSLASLKGKTIVLDFWATWCGPCKASFPGMQRLVTAYKDNPDVKFLFVNTWERHPTLEEKQKAVLAFITGHQYSFQVLMDSDSKVVEQFKVEAIPTKFIIGKDGHIKYKVGGYEENEARLIDEVNIMIDSVK